MGDVAIGQKVRLTVAPYPGRTFEGTVLRISPAVDRVSRTFEIDVEVPNPTRELHPGGYAKGEILTRVEPAAWTVPMSAVVTFVGSTKVYVNRDGVASAVPVSLGVEGRDGSDVWVELLRPDKRALSLESQVITSGHSLLADGVHVKIRQPGEESPDKAKSAEKPAEVQPAEKQPMADHAAAQSTSGTGGKRS
jgi:multidrug efflux pump subunit AcrA (membrane-fusion protein)